MSKQALIREASGNIVLKSDDFALRFFQQYGGAPQEWWKDNFPLLTNSFAGSGVSINWEVGQDPTQASANGFATNPIGRLNDAASMTKYGYYIRETIFDPSKFIYEVRGHCPDFWLSAESIDDTAPTLDGWVTAYHKPPLITPFPTTIVFMGSKACFSGLFFPGNEIEPGATWVDRLRRYENGRIAIKTTFDMRSAGADALCGLIFRKNIPAGANKDSAWTAPGYHFLVSKAGTWALRKMPGDQQLTGGVLLKSELNAPIQLEVRTNPSGSALINLLINGRSVTNYMDKGPALGPHAGVFAQSTSGQLVVGDRQFFDLNTEIVSNYSSLPGGVIQSDLSVQLTPGLSTPINFYRANLPGMFMNLTNFPAPYTAVVDPSGAHEFAGIVQLNNGKSFWIGQKDGSYGVLCKPTLLQVNNQAAVGAHGLLQWPNLMLNPFPYQAKTLASQCRIVCQWKTKLG